MNNRNLILAIAAILVAFGIYVYNYPPNFEEEIGNQTKDFICENYSSKKMNTLSAGVIHEIVNGYENRQLRYINSADTSTTDTQAIWFDLETIKKFIYHVEVNSKNLDDSISSSDLGLRFYYASYPIVIDSKDPELGDLYGKEYEKRHTLVAVPTKRIGNEDVDFNPLDIDTYALGLKATGKYDRIEVDGSFNFRNPMEVPVLGPAMEESSRGPQSPIGAQNHGNLYPPLGDQGLGF